MKQAPSKALNKGFTLFEMIMIVAIGAVIAGIFVFTANAPRIVPEQKPITIQAK